MEQEPVHYQADGGGEGRPAAERSVPRWRGPDPDPVEVARMYVQENRTETEIAVLLSVSRARVTAILRDARIPTAGLPQELPDRPRHSSRAGPCRRDGDLGGPEHGVSHSTAARWLAEARLLTRHRRRLRS